MLRLLFSGLVLFCALIASAQQKAGVLYQRYVKSDGLSDNYVTSIAQDQDGFLWIGTDDGLQRFDGHDFRTHNTSNEPELLSNNITKVFCDSKNRLWIQHAFQGISLWNLKTGLKQQFTPVLTDTTSLPDHRSFCFYEDGEGTIWISIHLKGIARFNEESQDFTLFNIDRIFPEEEQRAVNTARSIMDHPLQDSSLLIATFQGLISLNKHTGAITQLPIEKSNAEKPNDFNGGEDILRSMCVYNDSTLWISTLMGGLLKYNLNSNTYKSIKPDPPFPKNGRSNNFHDFAQRDEHSLWVSFAFHGLYILNLQNDSLYMVNELLNGTSEFPTAGVLLNGKFGHLWAGTHNGLLKLHTDKGFTDYQYLGYPIKDIWEGKNHPYKLVIPAGARHINIYKQNWKLHKSLSYVPFAGYSKEAINAIHKTEKNFILVTPHGPYEMDASFSTILPVTSFFNQLKAGENVAIIRSFKDSKGHIWMGTAVNGIYLYKPETGEVSHFSPYLEGSQPFTDHWILALYEDQDGRIWIGTERGYCIYNYKTQSFSNYPYPQNSKELNGFYIKEVRGFAQNHSGDMWVGSRESGLCLYPSNELSSPDSLFSNQDFFRNGLLSGIIEDKAHLYLHFSNGFAVMEKSGKRVHHFNHAFGANQIQGFTHNNKLALAKGFASPDSFHFSKLPTPRIYIDDLMIAGQKHTLRASQLQIPFDNNSIAMRLGILDLIEKERAQLQYRLRGLDSNRWTTIMSGQLLRFPYLDHGEYRLELRAVSLSGNVWNRKAINIEIIPLFWQRWQIQLLFIIIILALLSFPFIYRLRQKQRQFQMQKVYEEEIMALKNKAIKAQVNPHFLFNTLNSIRLMVMKNDQDSATEGIATFSRLVRKILLHSEKEEVSLAEELEAIREYISLEQMRFSQPFKYKENIDPHLELESIKIPPMLIQPFFENAIWHGLRTKKVDGLLEIDFMRKHGEYVLTVRDNGIGRAAARQKQRNQGVKSFGIQMSKERLRHFQNSHAENIEIKDLFDKDGNALGTEVYIRLLAGVHPKKHF